MIKLKDFFKLDEPEKIKVKFNMNPSDKELRAWDLLYEDSDEWLNMNEWKTKHPNNNLNRAKYLIALAQYYPYGPKFFVFGGIYRIERRETKEINDKGYRGYKLVPTGLYEEYEKRLIIKINKAIGRDLYNRWYEKIDSLEPEIYEITINSKLKPFPGYQNVYEKHSSLLRIINDDEADWKQALLNVKAVYLITDTKTGELYVGSASGNNGGLWQRWSDYANIDNLTGGNKKLEKIKLENGNEYIKDNFRYSILEIFDTKTRNDIIIERERHWMKVLDSIKHGMNC